MLIYIVSTLYFGLILSSFSASSMVGNPLWGHLSGNLLHINTHSPFHALSIAIHSGIRHLLHTNHSSLLPRCGNLWFELQANISHITFLHAGNLTYFAAVGVWMVLMGRVLCGLGSSYSAVMGYIAKVSQDWEEGKE